MSEQITSLNNNAPGTSYTNDNNGSQPLHQSTLTDMSFMSLKELHDSMKAPPSEDRMEDGVKIVSNLTRHLQFLVATVIYTTKQVEKGPVLLPMQEDIPYSTVLLVSTKRAQVLTEMMELELRQLHKQVIQLREKDNFAEADLITGWKPRHEKCSKFSLAYVTVTAVVGGALFGLWKMKKCLVP